MQPAMPQPGDFAVIRHVEQLDDDYPYERMSFVVYEITALTEDGKVRAVRSLNADIDRPVTELTNATMGWALPAAMLRRDEFITKVKAHCWPGSTDIVPWYASPGDVEQPPGELRLLIRMHRTDLPAYGSPESPIRPVTALRSTHNFGSGGVLWSLYDRFGSTGLVIHHVLPHGDRVFTMHPHGGPHAGRQVTVAWKRSEIRFPWGDHRKNW